MSGLGLAEDIDTIHFGPEPIVVLIQKSGVKSAHLSASDASFVLAPQDSWPPYPFLEGRRPDALWEQIQEILPSHTHILGSLHLSASSNSS